MAALHWPRRRRHREAAGFMGHLGRARIYAFDGCAFRETWRPEDRELLTITVTGCMDETVKLLPMGAVLWKQINNGECGDPSGQR